MGNEAVDQLTKFDRALRDFSAASGGQERGIDGMLVTKWDTVDDKVRHHSAVHALQILARGSIKLVSVTNVRLFASRVRYLRLVLRCQ